MSLYRWRGQSAEEHAEHMVHVAYRGMLEAVRDAKQPLPRKVLRGLQSSSIREYAKTIASRVNGM